MKAITENTTISLGVLAVLAGGIFWLSTLYGKTMDNSSSIEKLSNQMDEIHQQLSYIKGTLDRWDKE